MSCTFQRDSEQIQLAIHERLMRKLNNEQAMHDDADPIVYCDGEYHWRHFGYGPAVQQSRWLYESIIEKCPDRAKLEQEDFIGRHGDMERTFGNFIVSDENRDAYSKVKGWRKTVYKTLVMYGGTGRGKTHLAKAVQVEFLKDYLNTSFITAAALYEVFIKAQPAAREYDLDAMQQLADIREADLFVLDDLGSERSTSSGFFLEKLKQLLDEKRADGRMIVTTNLPPSELDAKYEGKLVSRLLENSISVALRGKDHRRAA
ncbi:MAG: DnaA/Hda family protein [Syntrophorhabdaceae bacterium]|nr:DnaA/Hda family protein [Syntrophorhabdaceae bacterium]